MVDKKQDNWTKRMEALERMIHGDDITDETEDFLKKMKDFLDQAQIHKGKTEEAMK